jgi:hypothetical protein
MRNDLSPSHQLPFEDRYENISLTEEHALGDLVEPTPAPRSGLHVDDVVEFGSATPRGVTAEDDDRPDHDDTEVGTEHDVTAAHHDNHGRTSRDARREHVDESLFDERAARKELLERDRFERQVRRERTRRERLERRADGPTHPFLRRRRRSPRRSGHVERRHERTRQADVALPGPVDQRADAVRDRRPRALSTDYHSPNARILTDVAADARPLKRPMATRVHGAALVAYFALLPYVVFTKWRLASTERNGALIRTLLVMLAIFWLGFLIQIARNVWRLRQGRRVNGGGSAWLAGLVVALLALLIPTSSATMKLPTSLSVPYHDVSVARRSPVHRLPSPVAGLGSVPLALMAKRRSDLLRQRSDEAEDFDVEESIELLRARNPDVISSLAALIGDALDGVLEVPDHPPAATTASPLTPIVACDLGPGATGSLVGFAREGGRLPIPPSWSSDDVTNNVVALHEGTVLFARSEAELLRSLATRTLRHSVVVYLGAASELDDELSACSITLQLHLDREQPSDRYAHVAPREAPNSSDLRVELLRADPQVTGLAEPFAPTLRRRCVEMVAYLALHRQEPVTGERLRTRVLTHADVDASQRTLANTASAVRRSLGLDVQGPRLHPVTSSGLYVTHGLSSDVEVFSTLVARARQLPVADAAPLAHQALLMIKGEPLASALRGFEWFLAEGHGARLARDGEWAALALHHTSLQRRNYELAFWSLQQGLLIDPYSDALTEALSRVPRLREFGGDGARLAQDESVGTRGAVAMSWAFSSFTQQVTK